MTAASILPFSLSFNPNPAHSFPHKSHQFHFLSPNSPFFTHSTFISFAFSPSNYASEGEEARWLREEQRWLREERRWLREEARWNGEREVLVKEIQRLKMRVEELERRDFAPDTAANIGKLLQVLKEGELAKTIHRIPESGNALPFVVETMKEEEEVIVKEVIEVPEKVERKVNKKATLRIGSEGNDVRVMQEALQTLGFYSGEEDMEYSSFSSGTERAVKTWQSSVGMHEDGVMTAELLELLYEKEKLGGANFSEKNKTNGTAIGSVSDVSEVGMKTEVEIAEHRVYLLGENRWEEPSKLKGRNKQPGKKTSIGKTVTKCVSCHGEGKLVCMECEGTGEPNIEPQFLEWIGEGAQCAYCSGLGYVACDVCDGRKVNDA